MSRGTFWGIVWTVVFGLLLFTAQPELAWAWFLGTMVGFAWFAFKNRYLIAERMLARRARKNPSHGPAASSFDDMDPTVRASEYWMLIAYNEHGTEVLVTLYYVGHGWIPQIWQSKESATEGLEAAKADPSNVINGPGEPLELRRYVWTGEREAVRG